jgi:tetratricopeptide (TPR) repeat protein
MRNLLGVAACLNQDFSTGIQQFTAALRLAERDPRLLQNRALALELAQDHTQAEGAWPRCIDALEERAGDRHLAIDAMLRLANSYSERLNHAAALPLLERAHHLAPENIGVLDRLFQLYRLLDRADLARRTLLRLNELLPGDPNLDLYDLELAPLRRGSDLEPWINTLERIVTEHPRERRVQERAAVLLGTFVNLVRDLARQASDQLARASRQVRSLHGDEINWRAVHKVMRDLRHELGMLRHAAGRALIIDSHPEHLRQLRDLIDTLEAKLDETRRWQQQEAH